MPTIAYTIKTLLFYSILTSICVGSLSHAQKATSRQTKMMQQSIKLMEKGQWQQTLNILNPLIEKNKKTGLKKIGAKFATAYYYKGLCLLKIAQGKIKSKSPESQQSAIKLFNASIASLNQCYAVNLPKDPSNIYRVRSLLLRGNAQQSLGQYQAAIYSYELFLLERNNGRDIYDISDFNINLAICLWKKSNPTPAENQKTIRLTKRTLYFTGRAQPSPQATLSALGLLSEISISTNDDQLIANIIDGIGTQAPENLDLSRKTTDSARPYSPSKALNTLGDLILITAQKDLPLASIRLSTLIPNIAKYTTDLQLPATPYITTLPAGKDHRTFSPETKNAITNTLVKALQARAITFKQNNQSKAAIKLYQKLVNNYSKHPQQPENLYNLCRLLAKSQDKVNNTKAITRARQFIQFYPEHKLIIPSFTILLNTLYHTEQYSDSLKLTKKILTKQKLNSNTILTKEAIVLRDSAYFIQAASHYYLGNFAKADTAFKYLKDKFPANSNNPYSADTAYLSAAVQNQLLNWDKSIPLLKQFVANTNYVSSIYKPFAIHDIAFAKYSQRKLHSSILALTPFTLDIPFITKPIQDSQISSSASILLGNTQLLLSNRNAAVSHYKRAIQLTKESQNTPTRDEAYYLLINLIGKKLWNGLTNHRISETTPYFFHFLSLTNARKSPYYTQILTSAVTALERANPSAPVHILLQKNLFTHNSKPNTPGVETALRTYLYYLRKNKIPLDEVMHILNEDVKQTFSTYHRALLTVAKIEVLERSTRRTENPEAIKKINALYDHLALNFITKDLDNFTILKLANHRSKNNQSKEAINYYKSILDTTSNIKKNEARLGLAIEQTKSTDPSKQKTALHEFTKIVKNPFTSAISKATAHHHILKLLLKEKSWPEIETNALAYLKYPLSVKDHQLEILELLALATDKQGPSRIDSAISRYTHIWSTAFSSIQHSAPAIDRSCQLLWQRNTPKDPSRNGGKSDRQLAYETAYKFIRKNKKLFAKRRENLSTSTIKTWKKIKQDATETYINDPSIRKFFGNP